ncbi:MAG: low molecular weight protein tyrosine phosphatase family protein [Pseudomarimonas sp.]
MTQNLLFICSQNRLRSPTAEQVFADRPGVATLSAGLNVGADTPVDPELLEWADVVFVMEKVHRRKLAEKFARSLANKRVICLDIPDDFAYMDAKLISLLEAKVGRHLPELR